MMIEKVTTAAPPMMIEKVSKIAGGLGAAAAPPHDDRKIKGKESKKDRSHDDRKSDDSIRGRKSNK